MNTQELAEATAEFDEEFVMDKFTPLTPEMQALWEKAKARRPRKSQADKELKVVSATLPKDLLARADAFAKKMGLSRSALIARGLKAVLAAEGEL
jgi:hypothetical protein